MATLKSGKVYLWTTWLAKILGGHRCLWSVWFRGRYKYDKFEEMAADLVKWNREHNALMASRGPWGEPPSKLTAALALTSYF